jgi:glycine/D-amino acid oxidase-like deaminating enzyme
MRRVVIIGGSVVGVGVALQLALTIVSLIAGHVERLNAGSLAGDAGFFAAFLGLALVPLAVIVVVMASIGRWIRARRDPAFFTRAILAAVTMTIVTLGLLLAGVGSLGGGIIPH